MGKSVFKVSKEVIEEHTPLAEFKKAPGWFRLLAAAYFKVIQFIDEETDTFAGLPTSLYVAYYQEEEPKQTSINILSGKPPLLTINIKEAYEKKCYPEASLFMNRPIINSKSGVHGRTMHISENQVHFFDSLKSEKGVFISNIFNARIHIEDLEKVFTQKINPLLNSRNIIFEKIIKEQEIFSEEKNNKNEIEVFPERNNFEILTNEYERLGIEIEGILNQLVPAYESVKHLDISKLSPQEFILRLYVELSKSELFEIEVLDL